MLRGVGRWQLRNSVKWMVTSSSTLAASSSSLAPSASRLASERGAKTNPLASRERSYPVRALRPTRAATPSLVDGEERRASSSKASSSSSESDANDLPLRFAEAARSTGAFHPGDLVLVCVSGGADSVTLLHLLVQLRDAFVRYTSTTKLAAMNQPTTPSSSRRCARDSTSSFTFASPRSPSHHPIFRPTRDNGVEM